MTYTGPFHQLLTPAQRAELSASAWDVVTEVDAEGWAVTVGGVWLDLAGVRHFQPPA